MTCPACGAAVPEGARFCSTCGHGLRVRADERRVVTVLFADLVGFTSLSETMDPEQVKNLVDRCFERLVGEIISFGGQVDKIIGDAIVALFGAPVAHEDDAERAVRAALRMQVALGEVAEGLGDDVRMRIGVNTGEVLVGALRAGGDYTAMGDVVNTASRLQTAAEPGQVLVGPATHAATRETIAYDHLGPLQARGRDEPVEAFAAIEALAPPGYRPHRLRTPLIGRDTEMGLLCHAVRAATERQRAQLILLVGEAGVGKSRLAEELATLAESDHEAAVLEGRCVPYGEANVWWPLADALRGGCGIEPDDDEPTEAGKVRAAVAALLEAAAGDEDEVERVTSGLLHLMGRIDALADLEPSRAREEVTRSLHAFFEAYASTRPVVLSLSDLHWADEVVLDAVDRLLAHLCGARFVLVATTRSHLDASWVPRIGRHNVLILNLEPLDRTATQSLLAALLESEPDDDLAALLLDRSGGNPLFLEELVALLAETGGPERAVAHLPDTLRGLVSARIDALTAAERATLEDAAVLGRVGPVYALDIMAQHRGHDSAAEAVDGLVEKDVLVVHGAHWHFRSDVIRDVAYNTLTKADRARRHTGVAQWLVSHEKDESSIEMAARHYAAATALVEELSGVEGIDRRRLFADALSVIERAARRAEVTEQYLAADDLFTAALRIAPPDDPAPRQLLLGRARARAGLRHLELARGDVAAAMESADGDERARAEAMTVLGDIEMKEGDAAGSARTLVGAIELWQTLGDRAGLAEAQRALAMTHLLGGDTKSAAAAVEEALAGFREIGDRRGEAWALQHLAWIAFTEGRADDAEDRINQSIATFNQIGDAGGKGWAIGLLGFVKFHRGQFDEAERIARQVGPEAEARGDRWACGMVVNLQASIRLWTGRAAEAAERAADASAIFESIGDFYGGAQARAILARSLIALGRGSEATRLLDEGLAAAVGVTPGMLEFFRGAAMAAAAQAGQPERVLQLDSDHEQVLDPGSIGVSDRLVALGFAHLQRGDAAAALEALERAAAQRWVNGFSPYADGALALALLAADRVGEGLARASRVCDTERATYLDRLTAQIALALGHARAGDRDEAAAAFAEARRQADGSEDRYAQALVRLAEARALDATGSPEDAAGLVEEAEERLALLDLDATGWDTVYRLALGIADPVPA